MFYTFLIGWLYLLPRLAFFPRSWTCTECGEIFHRRTAGSYVALIVLGLLLLLIVIAIFQGGLSE